VLSDTGWLCGSVGGQLPKVARWCMRALGVWVAPNTPFHPRLQGLTLAWGGLNGAAYTAAIALPSREPQHTLPTPPNSVPWQSGMWPDGGML
jgi:hypothetical protein